MTTIETIDQGSPRPSLLSPLKVRDFRLLWIGENISLLGSQFSMIAMPWLALKLTGSPLALGTILMVGGIPRALFMLVGGALTDRFSARQLMLGSNGLRAVLTFVFAALVLLNAIELWMLYVFAFVFGVVEAFFFPAQMAIVPTLVKEEQLSAGNALVQATAQLMGFIGPALAGLVIAALSGPAALDGNVPPPTQGIGTAFAIDALSFVVATVALALMQGGRVKLAAPAPTQGILASIGEGLRAAWSDPILRTILIIIAAINFFFTGPFGVGIPTLADTRFAEQGAAALGIIMSAFGGGALLGAIIAGSLPNVKRRGMVIMAAIGLCGVAFILIGYAPTVLLAAALTGICGLLVGFANVLGITWLHKQAAPELLGRIMSLVTLASFGLGPISNAVAGVVVEVDAALMFVAAGVGVLLVVLYGVSTRAMRAME